MRVKHISCEVYLEGVKVEFNSIEIQEVQGRVPMATINFPADSKVIQLLPKTVCHIYYLDETIQDGTVPKDAPKPNPEDGPQRLIFQGELSGYSMVFGFSSRQIALTFNGFTQNWENNYVLPMDVSIPNIVERGFMCINTPDSSKPNEVWWGTKEFSGSTATPLTSLSVELSKTPKLAVALKKILDALTMNQGIYLKTITQAFAIQPSIYIYDAEDIQKLIQVQTTSQYIADTVRAVDGTTTIADTLRQLLNNFGYEYCELGAPAMVDGTMRRIFIKPKTDFFPDPLMCNTVFDDDIANMSFQRNIDQEPTRLVNMTVPSYIGKNDALASILIATLVPQGVCVAEAFNNPDTLEILGLTKEEQCRGIVLSSHDDTSGIENAYYLASAMKVLKDTKVEDLDDAATKLAQQGKAGAWSDSFLSDCSSETTNPDAQAFHQYQINMATLAYLDQRHAHRVATVTTPYSPYRVVGFPGLILTKYFAALVGTLNSIDTQISADGTATQTLTFTHVRSYNIPITDTAGIPAVMNIAQNIGMSLALGHDVGGTDQVQEYKPSSEYAFMDDAFTEAPPWYKEFTGDNINKTYYEAVGRPLMSLTGRVGTYVGLVKGATSSSKLGFLKAAEILKALYKEASGGNTDQFIINTTWRPLPSLRESLMGWPSELRALSDKPIWKGMDQLGANFRALPWIDDRRKRVKEVFDYVSDVPIELLDKHIPVPAPNIPILPGVNSDVESSNRVFSPKGMASTVASVKTRYIDLATKYAKDNNLDPDSVLAVICKETGGHSEWVHSKGGFGSVGLMQIRSGALGDWNDAHPYEQFTPDQLMNDETNIKVGAYYLGQRFKNRSNDSTTAFASYFGGPTGWSTNNEALPYAEKTKAFLALLKKI